MNVRLHSFVVAVASASLERGGARILSCRVFGRKLQNTFLLRLWVRNILIKKGLRSSYCTSRKHNRPGAQRSYSVKVVAFKLDDVLLVTCSFLLF